MGSQWDGAELAGVAELLWRDDSGSGAKARPRLRAALIVETAIAIADAEGFEALSMHRVAAELGYTTMALYRHVPSRAHLVVAMADAAFGPAPVAPASPGGWRREVEAWVDALWQVYLRHPWQLRVPTLSAPLGPRGLAWFEALLRPLAGLGFGHGELVSLATFISSAVRDHARIAAELDPAGTAAYGEVLAQRLDPRRFPLLSGLAGGSNSGADDGGDVTPMMRFGLHRLLDGIDAYLNSKEGTDHG